MNTYSIKFRRKGKVIIWKDFYEEDLPKVIKRAMPEGLLGIDLTGYSVISIATRRSCVEQAHATLEEKKGVCVVYKYSWSNGYGQGVLVPNNIDPSKLRFFQTEDQKDEEEEEHREIAFSVLQREIENKFSGICVRTELHSRYLTITPEQEVFSDWGIRVQNIQEASEGIKRMMPLWKEWNTRGTETYIRRTGNIPQKGCIQIYKSPSDPNRTMVGLQLSLDHTKPSWVWFEKKENGEWIELEQLQYGPPPGV